MCSGARNNIDLLHVHNRRVLFPCMSVLRIGFVCACKQRGAQPADSIALHPVASLSKQRC